MTEPISKKNILVVEDEAVIAMMVEQLGGTVEMKRDGGTTFMITFGV